MNDSNDSEHSTSEEAEPAEQLPEEVAPVEREPTSDKGWRNWGDHPIVVAAMLSGTVIATVAALLNLNNRPVPITRDLSDDLEPCVHVIGRWDWLTTGGIVTVADGGVLAFHVNDISPVPTFRGNWSCNEDNGEIQMTWETGMSDSLFLSEDGRRIRGVNNQNGTTISATRRN